MPVLHQMMAGSVLAHADVVLDQIVLFSVWPHFDNGQA
jgi:hypothetical protein